MLDQVIEDRKNQLLPHAIETFNKLQKMNLKSYNNEFLNANEQPQLGGEGYELNNTLRSQLKGADGMMVQARTRDNKLLKTEDGFAEKGSKA